MLLCDTQIHAHAHAYFHNISIVKNTMSLTMSSFVEVTEDVIDTSSSSYDLLSDTIIKAQEEADRLADEQEALSSTNNDDNDNLPAIPRLLQQPQNILIEKTNDLIAKGSQLDLLLLKAESYSHFILENQKLTQQSFTSTTAAATTDDTDGNSKRKTATSTTPSKSKKQRTPTSKSSASTPSTAATTAVNESVGFQQPSNLVGGTLMPYQLEGLRWLLSLWENGLSGILADEMGLGKTIQIISLIAHLRNLNITGPFLIAGPLATLMNWMKEFKKWLPSCPVILYHGSKGERTELRKKFMSISNSKDMSFPVIITSFEILLIDRMYLDKYTWQYIILDEGHRIKNRNCKLVKELKQIRSVSRLLLTGTPIQNTLEELWSLLNFASPAIFDDLDVFTSWYVCLHMHMYL